MKQRLNLFGALLSVVIFLLCCSIFIVRIGNQEKTEYWLGIILLLIAIPLSVLLFTAKQYKRPPIYFLQIGLMIGFLILEFLLDYVFKLPFRETNWMTISYVTLFFASTGGMIGVASQAGKVWSIITIILFFNMVALAFYQRSITGM